jgi:membrane protein DedA with SNARE-associated domain
MTLAEFVSSYGYAAVLAGTLLEGEMILALAGVSAHHGHLSLPLVLLVAFVGGTAGDQIFFWIGRAWGASLMQRFPSLEARALRVGELLKRNDAALIVGIRFMYGLRIAGPIAMGACGVVPSRFATFNILGAAVWAPIVGGFGYLFGAGLEVVLGDVERIEETALLVAVSTLAAVALLRHALRWYAGRRLRRDRIDDRS